VDFGKILDKWEKQNGEGKRGNFPDKEKNTSGASPRGERRSRLLRKKPDAQIDLHGFKRDEAWTVLETFFEDSRRQGFEKVLIIHGKGNHRKDTPDGESVLKDLVRRFIENCSYAGESGHSPAKDGGSGTTWVFLKE